MLEALIARPVCLVFAVFAAYVILRTRRSLLGDEQELFSRVTVQCSPPIRERVLDAVARREREERLEAWPAWIAVVSLALICGLVLLNVLSSQVGLALQEVVLVGGMSFQVLGARRVSNARRLASLHPRTAQSVVRPISWWLPFITTLYAGISIVLIDRGNLPTFAVIASAAICAVVVASYAVRMPAVVGEIDPVADEVVDRRVRGARIGMLLNGAAAAPIILLYPALGSDLFDKSLHLMLALLLAFYVLFATRVTRLTEDDLSEMAHG